MAREETLALVAPQGILDAVPANIAVLDGEGRIVFLNRGWREFARGNALVGGTIGTDYLALCRKTEGEVSATGVALAAALTEILAGLRPLFERVYPCHGPGIECWFRLLAAPAGPRPEDGAVVMHFDITEQRRAEEERGALEAERRQTSKMEALGTFAGGIAHDFNNLLLGMAGLLDMALDEQPGDSTAAKRLRSLREAVEQAGALVRQILAFARREEPRRERVDLAATIDRALDLVDAGLPRHVSLERELRPVGEAIADPVQLQQVVMNLAANAVDAITPGSGHIRVRLDRVMPRGVPTVLKRMPHARLTFADDGRGITPEILERIFEPFFTTKDVGKGVGMGLAVVHGIVAAHRGHIEAESRLGSGSKFTIWLPLVRASSMS
jgi:two-component system cell cycle sensor histidine kinase/response regulator CckA